MHGSQVEGEELEFWYHGQFIAGDLAHMVSPAFKNDKPNPAN